MRKYLLRALVVAGLLSPFVALAGGLSVVPNPSVNLDSLRSAVPYFQSGGSMVVAGSVNGVPLHFIVDTGASLVVIPPAIAEQAGLQAETGQMIRLQTANGQVSAPMVNVETIAVGELTRRDVTAVIQNFADGHTGLLGMSFLSAYKMTVDHENQLLLLEPR